MTPTDALPLPVTVLRFTLRAQDEVRFPALAGSTLRGAIGNTLRTLTCATGAPTCDRCPFVHQCGFAQAWVPKARVSPVGTPAEGVKLADSAEKVTQTTGCLGRAALGPTAGRPSSNDPETAGVSPAQGLQLVEKAGHCGGATTEAGWKPAVPVTPAGPVAPDSHRAQTGQHASPPYVVVPPPYDGHPRYLAPGDLFGFRLHLFGRPPIHPTIWEAAARAAALTGFAEGRGRLTTTASIDAPFRPTAADGPWLAPVRLHFVTPLHIKDDRQRLDHFDPVAFTRRLTARIDHLIDLYGDAPSPLAPEDLAEMATTVDTMHTDLHPVRDRRQSDQQGRSIPITGFVGTATLDRVPRPLRSLWALAEHFHAGKGAPMGLGHVRCQTLD